MKNRKIPTWLTIEPKDRPLFFALTAIYGIYILPILLANRPCYDDLSRSLYGITGWNNDARPLTEKLVTWLCGGAPLGNVAPLPLLLSVLLLAYTFTLYGKRYLSSQEGIFPALTAGFLVIANPFLLSNLSYQFDNVTMTLALCAAVLPYVVPQGRALYKVFLFSFFLCLVTFTTYQPCCGIYIGFWFLELFFMLHETRVDIPRLFTRAAACGLSVLVYKYLILNHYIGHGNGSWQSVAYQFAWRSGAGIFPAVKKNFETVLLLIKEYMQGVPAPLPVLFGILLLSGTGFAAWNLYGRKKTRSSKIFSLLYLLLLPAMILFASLLPLLVLTPSIFSISAHSLICLSALELWAAAMLCTLYRRRPRLSVLLSLPCLLFALTFSYTFGNAMTSQKQYEEYMSGAIIHDVETLNADGAYSMITLTGKPPRSPETARLSEKYPLFRRIVPSHLRDSSYMGGAMLMRFAREPLEFDELTDEDRTLIETAKPVLANSVYACYENGEKIIVCFQE